MKRKFGFEIGNTNLKIDNKQHIQYINFKLAILGQPTLECTDDSDGFIELFDDIIVNYREKSRIANDNNAPIHNRINAFFNHYFADCDNVPAAICDSFHLDYHGLARVLSLPVNSNVYKNDYISSYRIKQGVLHNPKNDRRTTKGSFHIVEGDLAIPYDKKIVPKNTFCKLYEAAISPPQELLKFPFTADQKQSAYGFVSLLVKPIVVPEVPNFASERCSEILFVAPAGNVSNLDFVESVFGNAGDPSIHSNDAGIDIDGWTGLTGYILLAPHLTKLKKIDVGLPHYNDATERQRRDGMCYKSEDELYNDGIPFKITCRDHSGIAVTLIADNYFGYSKKEIKTQISFAANLFGNVEEEHAGGTLAFQRVNLGEQYYASRDGELTGYNFDEVKQLFAYKMNLKPQNYGVDKTYDNIIYLPENINIDLISAKINWQYLDEAQQLKLLPNHYYILPNGTKIHLERHPAAPAWKMVKTNAEGKFMHKPCTVSGGGKSEISKVLDNAIIYGSYYAQDLEKDLDLVQQILDHDFADRFIVNPNIDRPSRPILSVERTLGSVIKLLTPSVLFTKQHNDFIKTIPSHIKALVFMVKRFYMPEWGDDWRSHFSVDEINGKPGNAINFNNRKIRPSHLRVGFKPDGSWRIFKLRMDFMPTEKLQLEDDISASITVPGKAIGMRADKSYKFTTNCEYRFFQRPDDAIHKGFDKRAERDLSGDNLFVTNYRPLTKADAQEIKDDIMSYIAYSEPVVNHIEAFLENDDEYCIISSEPRIVDGKISKNPRYLENRRDISCPINTYLADIGIRFSRKVPLNKPIYHPVDVVLPGRRNNPASVDGDKHIRPLSVYNPLHYQELPELFMDYISSLTGKSPSTTGAGSEGALTKAPFNMLLPIYDLNSALLSYILSGYNTFTTPAGYIGNKARVDHDITMLIPELWARFDKDEYNPQKLIEEGALEKIEDFEYNGKMIPASILGYRITKHFTTQYFGKIFDEPQSIFSEDILKPEMQNMKDFVDGVLNIHEAHKKTAESYFIDGSIEAAIPPLKALLHLMTDRDYQGYTLQDKAFRQLFDKQYVLTSDWYKKRLRNKQAVNMVIMDRKINNLKAFVNDPINAEIVKECKYTEKLESAIARKVHYASAAYLDELVGTIGAEPIMLGQ